MIMTGKTIKRVFASIAYLMLICLLCAGCGKKQTPVQHISVVPPLAVETEADKPAPEETVAPEMETASEDVAEPVSEAAEPETEQQEAAQLALPAEMASSASEAEAENTDERLADLAEERKALLSAAGFPGGVIEPE